MRSKTLLLGKVIFIFLMLLGSISTYAQASYTLEYSSSPVNLDACGAPVQVKLKIQNTSSSQTLNQTFTYGFNHAGLYFAGGTAASGGISFTGPGGAATADGDLTRTLTASILPNTTAEVTFNVRAGCAIAFGNLSSITLSSPLKLIPSSGSLSLLNNIDYTITQKAFLTYRESINLDGSTRNGDLVVRRYVITNQSLFTFTGVVNFGDKNMSTALEAQSVKFTYENHATNPIVSTVLSQNAVSNAQLNGTGVVQAVSIPANTWLIIEETVRVVGCVDLGNGASLPVVRWGCYNYDYLPQVPNLDANITPPAAPPTLTFDPDHTQMNTDLNCYGSGNSATSHISFINTSSTTARNVRLLLYPRDPVVVPVGGVRVYITRANGTVEGPYTVNYLANNITPDYMSVAGINKRYTQQELLQVLPNASNVDVNDLSSIVGQDPSGMPANIIALRMINWNINTELSHYSAYNYFETAQSSRTTLDAAMYSLPFSREPLAHLLPQAGITGQGTDPENLFIIRQLVINKLIAAGGQHIDEIILNQNDRITVEYDEYSLCIYENAPNGNLVMSSSVTTDVRNECGRYYKTADFSPLNNGNPSNGDKAYSAVYVNASGSLTAGVNNTQGEVDRCLETADGRVENVGFKINFPTMSTSNINPEGTLQFKLYLQDGLDFDRSLEIPYAWGRTHNRGYNNLTNAETTCNKEHCDDPTCHPSTNVVSTADRYNFKIILRNGLEVPSSAITITRIASDKDISTITDGMYPITYNNVKNYNDVSSVTATFIYSITVDVPTLVTLISPTIPNIEEALRRELDGANVSFDLRAYCPSDLQKGASKWQMECSWIRCNSFVNTACATRVYNAGTSSEVSIDSYNAMPLFSVGSAILVNCPGCKIPGTELVSYTLLRTSLGLVDADMNGEPDPGATTIPANHPNRRVVTHGDIMQARIGVTMPDGSDATNANGDLVGCTKAQLDSRGYLLDNLYIKFTDVSEKIQFVPGSVQAALVVNGQATDDASLTWVTINPSDIIAGDGKHPLMVRIKASALGATEIIGNNPPVSNFHTNHYIIVRASFEMFQYAYTSSIVEFNYSAGFSGCDDCTDFGSVLPAIPGTGLMADANPASKSNAVFDFNELDAVGDKAFFWCTNGGNVIRYVPFNQRTQIELADQFESRSCIKEYVIFNYGYFYEADSNYPNYDAFPGEYRRFFGNDPLRHQLSIPTGYEPFKIYARYYHRQGNQYDEWDYSTITDPVVLQSMLTAQPANTLFNSRMDLTVNLVPDENNLVPNQVPYTEPANRVIVENYNTNTLTFPLDEENYNFTISVYLRPSNCNAVAPEVNLSDNWNALYKPLSNIPTIDWNIQNTMPVMNPHILENLAATPTNIAVSTVSYTPNVKIKAPNSELLAVPQGVSNLSTSASYIQVPVRIDCANLDRASFPYFTVSGPAMQKGLTLVGIYKGNKDLTDAQLNPVNSPFLYKHYSINNNDPLNLKWIVGIDETAALQTFDPESFYSLPKNSSTYYTLVFSYDCGSCSPIMDCKTPGASLDGQFCLNNDDLLVGYGWNCNSYPTFANLATVCKSYTPLVYKVSTSKVGLTANHYINNTLYNNAEAATLSSCSNFTYDVELSSCYKGELNNFEVRFTLPTGVTINTGTAASITLSDLFDITLLSDGSGYKITSKNPLLGLPREIPNPGDPDHPLTYSVIKLSVPMTINCSFTSGDILTNISATTYCGTPVSLTPETRRVQTTYDVTQVDNIDFSQIQVQVSSSAVTVNYNITTALAHTNYIKVTLPAAFVKQGTTNQRLITLTVPASGTGSETIAITPVNITCNSSYPVNVSLIGTYPTTCPSTGETCTKEVPTHDATYNIVITPFTVTLNNPGTCVSYNAVLTATPGVAGSYTYVWHNGTTLLPTTTASHQVTENGIYTVDVSDGVCSVTKTSGQIYIAPVVSLSLDNGAQSSLMCNPVAMIAKVNHGTPAFTGTWSWLNETPPSQWETAATATWQTEPATPTLYNISKYTASVGGVYMFTVTDANLCSSSTQINAPSTVKIIPPSPVCPGENPTLTITNLGNVYGTYNVGWFDASIPEANRVLLTSITYEGDYKAAAIVPGCTLTTATSYHISFKPSPVAFHITPEGYDFTCANVSHTAHITNISANDRDGNGNYYNDGVSFWWVNGQTTLNDQTFSNMQSFYIVAKDDASGCVATSNVATFDWPRLNITRTCTGVAGQVQLNASANFPEGAYTWWFTDPVTLVKTAVTTGLSGAHNSILTVTTTGIYSITNANAVTCVPTEVFVYENGVVSAAPNLDLLDDLNARFEGITTCGDSRLFQSDLGCKDRNNYNAANAPYDEVTNPTGYINPNNYGTVLPGNYMINYGTSLNANSWNPGYWQGSGYNSNGFMIVDGTPVLSDKVVWRMDDVPVTMGHYHLFRAMVRNITTDAPPVAQEKPVVYLKVTYYDASGNPAGYYSETRKILFNSTNQQWVELSGFTPTQMNYGSNDIKIAAKAKLELVIVAGTALGRDFALDNISFIPVGLCDDIQQILDNTGRNCGSVASVDFYQKNTCGDAVTFNVFDLATDPNITYTWKNASTGATVGTGKVLTVTPTATTNYILKVENAPKGCSFEQTVTAVKLPGLPGFIADNKEVCIGGSVELLASGANSYVWSPATGLNSTTIANPTATGLTANTTYTVTGTNLNGCSATKTVQVTVKALPTVSVTPASSNLCVGTALTLTASGADSYVWVTRPDLVPSGATAVLTFVSDPGNPNPYNAIIVTGTKNGCSATGNAAVYRKELPVVTLSDAILCAGGNGDFNVQGSASYTYQWTGNPGLSAFNTANPIVAGSYPRSYSLLVTDPSTGCTVTKSANVSVNYACGNIAPNYDGVDDRTTIPYKAIYNRGAGEFTIQAWVNLSATQGATYPTILASRTAHGNGFLWCVEGGATNPGKRFLFQILGVNYYSNTLATTLFDNQCHHLAVTRTTAGVLTLFVDGVAQGSYTGVTGSIDSPNTIMCIGNETNGTQPFRGSIGEVQFWNYAFTSADVANYRYNVWGPTNMYLIGYWKFKQTNTQVAVDESGVRNNGYYGNSVANTTYDPSFTGNYCGGPKVTSVTLSAPVVCAGKTVTVNYTTAGFASGVQLQVFVSNASGSFIGTPSFITTNGTNSGSFTLTASSTAGTNYLVKIKTSDNSTEFTSSPFEVTTQCMGLTLNGSNLATVPHNSAYNITTGDFTMEAWVNMNTTGQPAYPMILSKRTNTNDGFFWSLATGGTQMVLQLTGTNYFSYAFPTVYDGQCHHLAVRRVGTTITFFIDGSPRITTGPSSRSLVSTGVLKIGSDFQGYNFKGSINEIRFWNTGKSDADILNNKNLVYSSATANLIAYWRFKEIPGVQTIFDESATGNNGNLGTTSAVEATLDATRSSASCFTNDRLADPNASVEDMVSADPVITYYPNPFDKVLTVLVQDFAAEETTATIQLMNVNGVEVYKGEIQLNVQNELHLDLPAGIYMALIRYHDNSMYQHKVIKVQ